MSLLMAEPSLINQNPHTASEGFLDGRVDAELQPVQVVTDQVKVGRIPIKYEVAFPSQPIYEGLAGFHPGYGGYLETSEPLMQALAGRGIPTFIYGPARNDNDNFFSRLTNPQGIHAETIEAVSEHISQNLQIKDGVPASKDVNFDKQVLLPHSMGGLAAIPHADKHTQKVDAVIGLSSAGFGSPKIAQIAHAIPLGIGRAIRDELIPGIKSADIAISPGNLFRIVHYYARNPVRSVGEAITCLTQDVSATVQRLGEQGVRTAFIAFENDILIPPNNAISGVVDLYREMSDSGHSAPQFQAQRVAETVRSALQELHIME